MGCSK